RTMLRWGSDIAVVGGATLTYGTTLIRSWSFASRTSMAVTWDGHDRFGRMTADGRYAFVVTGTDAFGNRTKATRQVVVDRTASFLRWSLPSFYPQDGDTLAATAALSFRLQRSATVTLKVYDSNGVLVKTVWSSIVKAAGSYRWIWNGRNTAGAFVPHG